MPPTTADPRIKNTAGFPQIEKDADYTDVVQRCGAMSNLPTGTTLRKVIGNPNPDYTATLTNELS